MTKKFLKLLSVLSLIALIIPSCVLPSKALSKDASLPAASYAFGNMRFSESLPSINESPAAVRPSSDYRGMKLLVGGMPFGVKFITKGVLVIGFEDASSGTHQSGLRCNDLITSVNGTPIYSAEELNVIVRKCDGKPLKIVYQRDGKECTTTLTPTFSQKENRYTLGIFVRDSGAGIGTVTFIMPDSGVFGGLGHGICDANTGKLIPMDRGSVIDVKINGIVRGLAGSPGEVKGYFNSGKTGTLLGNSECGVWGVFAKLPVNTDTTPVEVGLRHEVKTGKAYIHTMLDGSKVERYEIEISDIKRDATGNKCFAIKVTDKALIDKTGGIIQGMSGSPIIQNGKLVGAVTHVLINDPTTGYGIFIENMLGQMGDLAG